jgi:hypothetical protein
MQRQTTYPKNRQPVEQHSKHTTTKTRQSIGIPTYRRDSQDDCTEANNDYDTEIDLVY